MSRHKKTIVLTAGGSGGHLVPLLTIAEVLKKMHPEYSLVYIGQKGDGLGDIMNDNPNFSHIYTVRAGKFRRYHGAGLKQLLDIKTVGLNIRDFFFVAIGIVQSFVLLGKIKPSAVFSRGGYVSVPVCLAAAVRRIPYMTHDSDAIPSLANRIIAPWASMHAVALPKELYSYPQDKTLTTGVPISDVYRRVTIPHQQDAKYALGLPKSAPVLLVTGGGNGAVRLNTAVTDAAKQLYKEHPALRILHVAGRTDQQAVEAAYATALGDEAASRVQVFGFTDQMARMSEAADVVVTRAGATTLAEFSTQGKSCIIVPNPQLTGGHQSHNARAYKEKQAAVVVTEDHLAELGGVISALLADKQMRQTLQENILQFAYKDASRTIVSAIMALVAKHA